MENWRNFQVIYSLRCVDEDTIDYKPQVHYMASPLKLSEWLAINIIILF